MNTDALWIRTMRDNGLANTADIIRAHRNLGENAPPLSVCCAMLQMETNGLNVFGHDPVRRGQVWGGKVTRLRYAFYKARRRALGNQGVGPCQLTSPGLQDEADARGGCWKPLHNMEVGFQFLTRLRHQHGTWRLAFQHYNGSGPAAEHYGASAVALAEVWHNRLA